MKFDDIVKREGKTDELKRQKKKLELEFNTLKDSYYSEIEINKLKQNMKQNLFEGFKEYFKILGFEILVDRETHSHLGQVEICTARIGDYKVKMYTDSSDKIWLDIQNKKDNNNEIYLLSTNLSKVDEFKSCMQRCASYDLSTFNQLIEVDIKSLKKIIQINKPLEIVYKFNDGQSVDMRKEYKLFEDIIDDIPEK